MDKEKKLFDEEYLEGPIGQVTKEENTGEMINLMNVWAEGNGINKGTTCFDVTHDETAGMATVWVEGTQKHTYEWTKDQGTTKKKYAKIREQTPDRTKESAVRWTRRVWILPWPCL